MGISMQPSSSQIMIDQKHPENKEYFKYFGGMITNDARCAREIISMIVMEKAAFNKKKSLCTSKLASNIRKKLVKCYIGSIACYGPETWTLRKADQKYLENFKMWYCRRMDKNSWIHHARNEAVLRRVKNEWNMRQTVKKEGNLIGTSCIGAAFLNTFIHSLVFSPRDRSGRNQSPVMEPIWLLKEK